MYAESQTTQFILDRRAIRHFTDQPLTDEQVRLLADIALSSPSAMNQQPWQFHFIRSQAVIAAINEAALHAFRDEGNKAALERAAARHPSIFYGAPLVVVISLPRISPSHYAQIDAGIAVENLAVGAQSLGLGSCIIGMAGAAFAGRQKEQLASLIKMAEDRVFAISIAIGHPGIAKEAHEHRPDKIVWIT